MATQQQTKADEQTRTTENREQQTRGSQQGREQGSRQQRESGGLQRQQGGGAGLNPFAIGPFALIRRMQDEMDRLFGGFGTAQGTLAARGQGQGQMQADWAPPIETFQRGNEFVIRLDLPGVPADDAGRGIGEEAVTVRGERREEREEERDGIYVAEVSYGSFVRVVPLPPGAITEKATAEFKDGVSGSWFPRPLRRRAEAAASRSSRGRARGRRPHRQPQRSKKPGAASVVEVSRSDTEHRGTENDSQLAIRDS